MEPKDNKKDNNQKLNKENTKKTTDEREITGEEELKQAIENAKRAMADLQNTKARMEKEKILAIIRANADLMSKLLSPLDNLYRALEHKPNKNKEWEEGIEMSIKQISKVLEESGLEQIKSLNQNFDPSLHEALSQGPGKKDQIIQVIEEGYRIGDYIVRHAKVIVGNGEKAK